MLSNSSSRFFFDYNLLERIYGNAAELNPFRQWNPAFLCAQFRHSHKLCRQKDLCVGGGWRLAVRVWSNGAELLSRQILSAYLFSRHFLTKKGKRSKAHACMEWCAGKASYPLLMVEITMRWQYSWREEEFMCTFSIRNAHTTSPCEKWKCVESLSAFEQMRMEHIMCRMCASCDSCRGVKIHAVFAFFTMLHIKPTIWTLD